MEQLNVYIIAIAGVIAGCIIGYFIGRYITRQSDSTTQLRKLQKEFDEYRDSVKKQFVETVTILSKIDENQRKLYQSVADGVTTLISTDGKDSDVLLEENVRALSQLDQKGKKVKR